MNNFYGPDLEILRLEQLKIQIPVEKIELNIFPFGLRAQFSLWTELFFGSDGPDRQLYPISKGLDLDLSRPEKLKLGNRVEQAKLTNFSFGLRSQFGLWTEQQTQHGPDLLDQTSRSGLRKMDNPKRET